MSWGFIHTNKAIRALFGRDIRKEEDQLNFADSEILWLMSKAKIFQKSKEGVYRFFEKMIRVKDLI